MDWDKLRIFHAVAGAGSFTHAGETLNLSQSAVSRQIQTLEESLGVPLFHRHARGLILTEQGELLQKAANDIFARLAMIEGQLADSKQLPEGPLRITTTDFIGSTWLAPHLAEFQDMHPGIRLTLLFDDRILNLAMREADAAIRLYKPEQPDLIQRHLATIGLGVYGSKAYLKRHEAPHNEKDLRTHTLIGFPEAVPTPYADPNRLFRIAGVEHSDEQMTTRTLLMNSLHAMLKAVESGAGLAVLPNYLARGSSTMQRVLPAADTGGIDMYFVYPEERRHSQRIAIFRDFLLELVEKTGF